MLPTENNVLIAGTLWIQGIEFTAHWYQIPHHKGGAVYRVVTVQLSPLPHYLVKILSFMWSTNFSQMYERLINSWQQPNICPLQRQVCWRYWEKDLRLYLITIRSQPTYHGGNMQCSNVTSVTMTSYNWHCALNGQYSVYQPSVRESCLRHARFEYTLTFWHRIFTFNSNKSLTWCKSFSVYYPDVCLQLNMFRALSHPSSGAQWLQWQPLVLTFVSWW